MGAPAEETMKEYSGNSDYKAPVVEITVSVKNPWYKQLMEVVAGWFTCDCCEEK